MFRTLLQSGQTFEITLDVSQRDVRFIPDMSEKWTRDIHVIVATHRSQLISLTVNTTSIWKNVGSPFHPSKKVLQGYSSAIKWMLAREILEKFWNAKNQKEIELHIATARHWGKRVKSEASTCRAFCKMALDDRCIFRRLQLDSVSHQEVSNWFALHVIKVTCA